MRGERERQRSSRYDKTETSIVGNIVEWWMDTTASRHIYGVRTCFKY